MTLERLDEGELYFLIRKAVTDAIWGVLATLAMILFSGFLVLVGGSFIATGATSATGNGLLPMAFGGAMVGVGLLTVLREFGIWPFK